MSGVADRREHEVKQQHISARRRWLPSALSTAVRRCLYIGAGSTALGVSSFFVGSPLAQAGAMSGNKILPDGRTKTSVTVNGSRTDIHTQTVSKNSGFNSFSHFKEAAGQEVNLYLPKGAENLINLVHNDTVVINGVLNAYKDGKIGGNVYFADPHGFVVGQSGVVNVGKLVVNTPTAKFLDKVISKQGVIDDAAVNQLMRGDFEQSPDGFISISGVINAKGGITLQGQAVSINGIKDLDDIALTQQQKFAATVNNDGLEQGARLVAKGGSIHIEAADQAFIAGELDASAEETGAGGQIDIKAGGDIRIKQTAKLAADGAGVKGDGGQVVTFADETIEVADGAQFSARGAGEGGGGFIEVSGNRAQVGAASFNLGADKGKAGTLLFDPYDLVIEAGNGNVESHGADVILQADNAITIASSGMIDTRQQSGGTSSGDSGDITLEAAHISLKDGAQLRADVDEGSTHQAGNITLTATGTDDLIGGKSASITVGENAGNGPVVKGGNITFTATTTANTEDDEANLLDQALGIQSTIEVLSGTIEASNTFTATATTELTSSSTEESVSEYFANLTASVHVGGDAQITAATTDMASATDLVLTLKAEEAADSDHTKDAAAALTYVDSLVETKVDGDAKLIVTGAANLQSSHTIQVDLEADPGATDMGASVAAGIVDIITATDVVGNASVDAGNLTLGADSDVALNYTATAASKGADTPESGTKTNKLLNDDGYGDYAETGESSNGLAMVGALALSDLTADTHVTLDSTGTIDIANELALAATTVNRVSLSADASSVSDDSGIAAAFGLNIAHIINDALLGGEVSAGAVDVSAEMKNNTANQFNTAAKSGAGADNFGIAGAFVTNLIDTDSRVSADEDVQITANNNISLHADNQTRVIATATPKDGGAQGENFGLGASMALNIVANRTLANVAQGAKVTSEHGDIALTTTAVHHTEALAEGGAGANLSIVPAAAINLINNRSATRLDGGEISAAGDIHLTATQLANTQTQGSADAQGDVAIGAVLGLAIIDDQVSTSASGSLTGRDIELAAAGASQSHVDVTAAAGGTESADDNAQSGNKSLDKQSDDALASAQSKQNKADIGDTDQQTSTQQALANQEGRKAETSEGSLSVAAAFGVNQQDATVTAGATHADVTASGNLVLQSRANTDGKIIADGSTVGDTSVGIGAAAGVNLVHVINRAVLGSGAYDVHGLKVQADQINLVDSGNTDPRTDTFSTTATSGAGGSSVGIAGSLALNLIDTDTRAAIADTDNPVTLTLNGGDVSISADNRTHTIAEATPHEGTTASGDVLGVGASAAINLVANRTTALIGQKTVFAAANSANNLTMAASATHTVDTTAVGGSASDTISFTPVLALAMVNNRTDAVINDGAYVVVSGDAEVVANQKATTNTTAEATADSDLVALGASAAISLIDDSVHAGIHGATLTAGSARFTAAGASLSNVKAVAGSAGAHEAGADGKATAPEQDQNENANKTLAFGQDRQALADVGDDEQRDKTQADVGNEAARAAETSEGTLDVAAAFGLNQQDANVTAGSTDATVTTTAGDLVLQSSANTDGKIIADGSSVDKATTGIGAAAGVNLVHAVNQAVLGSGAYDVHGLKVQADQINLVDSGNTDPRTDTFSTTATSGAGGSSVGIAGSLALNLIDTDTRAAIADTNNPVTLTLNDGDVSISADNRTHTIAEATPHEGTTASGDVLGVGASAAINYLANRTLAEVDGQVTFTDAHDLDVAATAAHQLVANAQAGAAGGVGITPVAAIQIASNRTQARLGAGDTLQASGNVTVQATQTLLEETTADAAAAGEYAGVGAALALNLIDDVVWVTTARAMDVTGNVTFAATNATEATLLTKASAAGAKAADENGAAEDGKNVDEQAAAHTDAGKQRMANSGIGSAEQQQSLDNTSQQDHSADTGEGVVSVAAAVGINNSSSMASAQLADSVDITSGDTLTVTSANLTSSEVTADGRATDSTVNIGAAVAINALNKTNHASLGNATYAADNGVVVEALSGKDHNNQSVDTIIANAMAGAGGGTVGIAGALALNNLTLDNRALINSGATVTVGSSGASKIHTEQQLKAQAHASPVTGAGESKVGVGADVALNVIASRAQAEIADGARFNGGASLDVNAESDIATLTHAEAGAAGGFSFDAAVAIASLDEATTARIGTGSATTLSGDVTIRATNQGEHIALAEGDTKSESLGVGATVALVKGSGGSGSVTSATLARDLTAQRLIVNAEAERAYLTEATATAGGGKDNSADGSDKAASTGVLNDTKDHQKDAATEDGTDSGAYADVAAAVAISLVQDSVLANINNNVEVSLADELSLGALSHTGVATLGSGQAVRGDSAVGVGVGVGLAILESSTRAALGEQTKVTAGDITIKAESLINAPGTTNSRGTDYTKTMTAGAVAGAGADTVAFAGAVAVVDSESTTEAVVGNKATVNSTGSLEVSADNTAVLSAGATAAADSSGAVGIGASVATLATANRYRAMIVDEADIAAKEVTVQAKNHRVNDPGLPDLTVIDWDTIRARVEDDSLVGGSNYYVIAQGGAAADSVAVQGSFGLLMMEDKVEAAIGSQGGSGTTTIALSGNATDDLAVTANNEVTANTFVGGDAKASSVGVGVSSAVVINRGTTHADIGDHSKVENAHDVTVSASAEQDINTLVASSGSGDTAAVNGTAAIVTSQHHVAATVGSDAVITAVHDVVLNAANALDAYTLAGSAASGGSAGIGASAAVVTIENRTLAEIADAPSQAKRAQIKADGKIDVVASANEQVETRTSAGAKASGAAGVGAGAAVFVFDTDTTARVGKYALLSAFNNALADVTVRAEDASELVTQAGASGVASTAGVGAAASVANLSKNVLAELGNYVEVTSQGDVRVATDSTEMIETNGSGVGVGGTAGVAGTATVLALEVATQSRIGRHAEVFANGSVGVLANDLMLINGLSGAAGAGGSAGVGASAGISVIDSNTRALIDQSAQVTGLGQGAGLDYVTDYDVAFSDYSGSDLISAPTLSDEDAVSDAAGSGLSNNLNLLLKKRQAAAHRTKGHGVIVNASSETALRQMTVSGAAGGAAGVALSASVPVVTTQTDARIAASAKINQQQQASAAAQQSVTVNSVSDYYSLVMSGNAAGGGAAGVGAGAGVAVLDATTTAAVESSSELLAKKDIHVAANASEDQSMVAVSLSGAGAAAVSGAVSTLVMETHTAATLGGDARAYGNVLVTADDDTRTATMAGGLGGAGVAGVGAGVSVVDIEKTVTAAILDNATIVALGDSDTFDGYTGADFAATQASTGVGVLANSSQSNLVVSVAAGGAGIAAVAGAVSLELADVDTTASVGNNVRINQPNNLPGKTPESNQDVIVSARNNTNTLALAGGVAGAGIAGIAGAVDIGIFNTNTTASIGNGSQVNAKRDVLVTGLSDIDAESVSISAAGAIVGVAAGISIYSYGDGIAANGAAAAHITEASGDHGVTLTDVVNQAQQQTQNSDAADQLAQSDSDLVKAINQQVQAKRGAINFSKVTDQLATPVGTSATVGSATINAGGTVGVMSLDQLATEQTTGAIAGGLVGVGAGVGVTGVHTTNTAQIMGAPATITANALSLQANTQHDINATSLAAAMGLVSAEAAVAVANDTSRTLANITNATINIQQQGDVLIGATSQRQVDLSSAGASLGAAAVGASVATANLGGEVSTGVTNSTLGSSSQQAGNISVFAEADNQVESEATAVAGGLGLALNAAVASSSNETDVGLDLTTSKMSANGLLALAAKNNSEQHADASGLAFGFAAMGGAVATVESANKTTTHLMGENTLTGLMVSIYADGLDRNTAAATAGAGGVVAGNAAVATTKAGRRNGNDVATRLEKTLIDAAFIDVKAEHQTEYAANTDARSAGLASASGAYSANDADINVLTDIGSNSRFSALGQINIDARNLFNGTSAGTYASGGAGGGIAGAGAVVNSQLSGTTNTRLGNHIELLAGLEPALAAALIDNPQGYVLATPLADPFANPGGILIGATSLVNTGDTVAEMNVGGVLGGADANGETTVSLATHVTVGDNNTLLTNGSVGIGSQQLVNVAQQALAHSYGGGASSDTLAKATINADESVTVGSNNALLAFKDVRLTSGRRADGFAFSSYNADSIANAYASGGIALSDAKARTHIDVTSDLILGSGTLVQSVRDINIESRTGDPVASAKGTSRSDELGFIPVTDKDSKTSVTQSATAIVNADVIAGIYNDNQVVIDDSGNLSHTLGAPLFYQYLANFNPHDYIDAHTADLLANVDQTGTTGVPTSPGLDAPQDAGFDANGNPIGGVPMPGAGGNADPAQPQEISVVGILKDTTTGSNVKAYRLGALHAEGGDVYIHADTLDGNGDITAKGSPTIDVQNDSDHYLIVGKATINDQGGKVHLTGGLAHEASVGPAIHEVSTGELPTIDIRNTTYDTVKGGSETISQGPAIFLEGAINNLGGLVKIANQNGSVGQFAPLSAQQIEMFVPNGAVAVYMPDDIFHSGGDPVALWRDYAIDLSDPRMAIAYVANQFLDPDGDFVGDSDGYTHLNFQHSWSYAGARYWTDDPDFGGPNPQGNVLFYGYCVPGVSGADSDCGQARAAELSPIGVAYKTAHSGYNGYYPAIPVLDRTHIIEDYPSALLDTAEQSAMQAKIIVINAQAIDINSKIVAGSPVDVKIKLSDTDLSGQFSELAANQKQVGHITTDQGRKIYYAINQPGIDGGQPPIAYEDGRIQLRGVNASGGGVISLTGDIVSTTTAGQLRVNNGYGEVDVYNDSSLLLDAGSINTGTSPLGQVIIADTKKGQKTWYYDTPGVGREVRVSDDLNATFDSATVVCDLSSTCGPAGEVYNPKAGLRYQWTEQLNLRRPIQTWNDGTVWQYVDGDGDLVNKPAYIVTSSGIVESEPGGPAFKETINSTFGVGWTSHAYYPDSNDWETAAPTSAQLNITKSTRADNPIGIFFDGNERGSINITSLNSAVQVSGKLANPSGTTSISSFNGSVDTVAGGHVIAETLTLFSAKGVGSKANPFSATLVGDDGYFGASVTTPLAVAGSLAGQGGIYADFDSSVRLSSVSAHNSNDDIYGAVVIGANGSIHSYDTNTAIPNVVGLSVSLDSRGGEIGTANSAVSVKANPVDFFGFKLAGEVNAVADGDIHLLGLGGDLLVEQIRSRADGDIHIEVPEGALLSKSGMTSGEAIDDSQLDGILARLHLLGDDATTVAETKAKDTIESRVVAQYRQYWNLLDNGQLTDGQFVLDDAAVARYRPLVAAQLDIASPTDTQVKDFTVSLFQQLQSDLGAMGVALDSQNANFAYVASTEQIAAVTKGARFADKKSQLVQAINIKGLQDSVEPTVGTAEPTIEGHHITLEARDGVGELGNVLNINFDQLRQGNLSDKEAAALAAATAPGDVLLKDANGTTIDMATLDQSSAARVESVQVGQTVPLFITATGDITTNVTDGSVFLQGNTGLNLKDIYAKNDIRLITPGDILSAGNYGEIVIRGGTAGDLVLLAGGNIGYIAPSDVMVSPINAFDSRPIRYHIGNKSAGNTADLEAYKGRLVSAVAGGDIAITAAGRDRFNSMGTGRDLILGQVSAGGDVMLHAPGGGIYGYLEGLGVSGNNVNLEAWDNIGMADSGAPRLLNRDEYLAVVARDQLMAGALGSGAMSSLESRGNVRLQSDSALNITEIYAGELLDLLGSDDIIIDNVRNGYLIVGGYFGTSSPLYSKGVWVTSGGTLTIDSLASDGNTTLTAADAIDVDTMWVWLDAKVTNSSSDIRIDEFKGGGSFTADTTGDLRLGIVDTFRSQFLTAGGDVEFIQLIADIPSRDDYAYNFGYGDFYPDYTYGVGVDITAGGSIRAQSDDLAIVAKRPGSGYELGSTVVLAAEGGIGGPSQAPLRVDTRGIMATSAAGDINIHNKNSNTEFSWLNAEMGSLNLIFDGDVETIGMGAERDVILDIVGSLSRSVNGAATRDSDHPLPFVDLQARQGKVNINTGGNLDYPWIQAGTTVTLNSGAKLDVSTLDSSGDQHLTAVGNLYLANPTVTAGNLYVTSTNDIIRTYSPNVSGNIEFKSVRGIELQGEAEAGGNIHFDTDGDIYQFGGDDSITSKQGWVLLESGADIDLTEVTASTTFDAIADAGITLREGTSGGDMTLISSGDITFSELSSGAAISLTSSAGSILDMPTGNFGEPTPMFAPFSDVGGGSGSIASNSLLAVGNIEASAASKVVIGDSKTTSGRITVDSGADMVLGSAVSVGSLELSAGGGITYGVLQSDANLVANADGFIRNGIIETASSGGPILCPDGYCATPMSGLNIDAGTDGPILVDPGEGGDDFPIGGNPGANEEFIFGGEALADGFIKMEAGGYVFADTLTAGSTVTLQSDDDLMVIEATANDNMTLQADGFVGVAWAKVPDAIMQIVAGDDVELGTLISERINGVAVDIDAGGAIVAIPDKPTNEPGNIYADEDDASIHLVAGNGIGDPLVVSTLHLDATARQGDIHIVNLRDLATAALDAENGSIDLTVEGDLDFSDLHAADNASLTATGGSIHGENVNVGNEATFSAGTEVNLSGELNGLIGASATDGVEISADNDLTLGIVKGNEVVITADGNVSADDVTSGSTLDITSGGTMTLGRTESGAEQTLTAQDDLSFDHLASNTDLTAESVNGSILGGDFTVGGVATFLAGQDVVLAGQFDGRVDQVQAGGDVEIDGDITEGIDSIVAGGSATVEGTGADTALGQVTADDEVAIIAAGDLSVDEVTGDGVTISATGDLSTDEVVSTSTLAMTSGGDLSADSVTSGSTLDITSGGTMTLGRTESGAEQTLTAQDDLSFDHLASNTDLTAESVSGSIRGGDFTVGGVATFFAGQDVALAGQLDGQVAGVTAGDNVEIHGDITEGIDSIAAGGSATVEGTGADTALGQVTADDEVAITAAGDLSADSVTSSGTLDITSGGTMTLGRTESGADQTLTAQDDLSFDHLASNTDLTAESVNGSIRGGDFTVGGVATFLAGQDVALAGRLDGRVDQVQAGGDVEIGGDITEGIDSIAAGGSATVEGTGADTVLGQVTAGDEVAITAAGDLSADSVTSGGTLDITSGGTMMLGQTESGAEQTLTAQDDLSFDHLASNTDLTAESVNGSILGGDFTVGGVATFLAGQDVVLAGQLDGQVDQVQAGGDVEIDGDITEGIDTIAAGGSATVEGTGADTVLGQVTADDEVAITATGDLAVDEVTGDGVTISATGDLSTDEVVSTSTLAMTSGGDLSADDVTSGGTLDITSGGTMMLGRTESGAEQTLTAQDDLSFDHLGAAEAEAGAGGAEQADVLVTSRQGDITGGTVVASGNVHLQAKQGQVTLASTDRHGNSIDSLGAGGSAAIEASDAIDVGNLRSGDEQGGITLSVAQGGITAGDVTSSGAASVVADDAVALGNVSAGSTINVVSTDSTTRVGNLVSGGSQTLTGHDDVVFGDSVTTGVPGGDAGHVSILSEQGDIDGNSITSYGITTTQADNGVVRIANGVTSGDHTKGPAIPSVGGTTSEKINASYAALAAGGFSVTRQDMRPRTLHLALKEMEGFILQPFTLDMGDKWVVVNQQPQPVVIAADGVPVNLGETL